MIYYQIFGGLSELLRLCLDHSTLRGRKWEDFLIYYIRKIDFLCLARMIAMKLRRRKVCSGQKWRVASKSIRDNTCIPPSIIRKTPMDRTLMITSGSIGHLERTNASSGSPSSATVWEFPTAVIARWHNPPPPVLGSENR